MVAYESEYLDGDYDAVAARTFEGLTCTEAARGAPGGNPTEGADRLRGGDAWEVIEGFGGADRIWGEGGDDVLRGGEGADRLLGGAGRDMADYRASDAGVRVDLDERRGRGGDAEGDRLSSIEWVRGSRHDDRPRGSAGEERLWGERGADRLEGGSGADRLYGGSGDDRLWGDNGADRLYGQGGSDRMRGGGGSDRLYGQDGADRLRGDDGSDRLHGGDGSDRLAGGAGADRLHGGAGADRFEFSRGDGRDRVMDFEDGRDALALDGALMGRDEAATVLRLAEQRGDDVVLDFGRGDVLVIEDATIAQIRGDIDVL